ncbi:MAG: NAD(P)/FAD-dependent oxidoreductase [Thermoleophilia bacterium]
MTTAIPSSPERARTDARPARGGLLIVGGGFAGASLARMAGTAGATIVSPENFMLYTPLLPDVAAGTVEPRHVVMPLRQMCPHADLILGAAAGLDEDARVLTVVTDTGTVDVAYDRLVLSPGAGSRSLPVPGLAEHAVGFKTIEDAVHLRNTVLHRLDQADAAPPDDRDRHLTFVFVGGGYAGVEAVAQLHELVQHALRSYPRLAGAPQRWILADAAPRILASVPGRLGEYAARQLTRRGIEIHTGARLLSAEGGRAVLSDGTDVATETLVWSAGVAPSGLGAALGLPVDEAGRIVVDGFLRVEGRERIHALGDAARVPNAATPAAIDPPTCQHALRQARRLAKNIRRERRGRPPLPYAYRTRGQMALLGRHSAIAEVAGLHLRGIPAWLMARTYHLNRLPLRRRRMRVAADWAASAVFPWDITQLGSLGHPQPLADPASGSPNRAT